MGANVSLGDDGGLAGHGDERGANVRGVGCRIGELSGTTDHHGTTVGLCGGDGGLHALECGRGDERADERGLVERAADGQAAVRGGEPTEHLVETRAMGDEAAQAGAALAGGARRSERDATHHQFDVGAGGDDGGVVAAELEDAAPEPCGHDRTHLAAHGGAARRADDGHALVGDQRGAGDAIAQQHLVEVGGHVHARGGALEQRIGGECGERRELAGLPDDRVAAHQRQRGVPAPHGDREVERRDDGRGAHRVPLLHQAVAGTFAGDGEAVQLT